MITKNRITSLVMRLTEEGNIEVTTTKEFTPDNGGGSTIFFESSLGESWHKALDVARGMVTVSPARNYSVEGQ